MVLQLALHHSALRGLFNESAQAEIAEPAALQRLAAGPIHPFTRMAAGQADDSLDRRSERTSRSSMTAWAPGRRLGTDPFSFARAGWFHMPLDARVDAVAGAQARWTSCPDAHACGPPRADATSAARA